MTSPRRLTLLAAALAVTLLGVACGTDAADPSTTADGATTTAGTPAEVVRLGYFPNVTHAPALVGVAEGTFARRLGGTKLETSTFNAGPEAVEALFATALDIAYIGPNPTINAFNKSGGEAVRIVSGSTSGGAFLVVRPGITSAQQLRGAKVASPQLGGTQDVALRTWLKDQGLTTDTSGGGDVSITPQENADTLTAFTAGTIAGAWVPEPWATRLVQEGGGKVLVDEATLWPNGRYVTTQIVVRTQFLEEHPDTVKAVLEGHLDALDAIAANPTQAQGEVNAQIEAITKKRLPEPVIAAAWKNLTFTPDPVAASLRTAAKDAESVGLLTKVDLKGIYSLDLLNGLLTERGDAAVAG